MYSAAFDVRRFLLQTSKVAKRVTNMSCCSKNIFLFGRYLLDSYTYHFWKIRIQNISNIPDSYTFHLGAAASLAWSGRCKNPEYLKYFGFLSFKNDGCKNPEYLKYFGFLDPRSRDTNFFWHICRTRCKMTSIQYTCEYKRFSNENTILGRTSEEGQTRDFIK